MDDGWVWLYGFFEIVAPRGSNRRQAICSYFCPRTIERWHNGLGYRLLGVHLFGALIPTGGIIIRRMTGSRMAPYTLRGTSLEAARDFYYRACVFEALHLPFFLVMAALALHRASIGRWDLALENTLINLAINFYPMMHHRRTRLRIVHLIARKSDSRTAR